ncbi:NAD(P)-dependent oxidoreductase [Subtercola sp. YIM 133946]|uniref:NAD(P)-dependent oxidoreductase n=1 Tax=Subtercola sp. YIM 133946 TaxID=3118909 RepID=UPI002F93FE58
MTAVTIAVLGLGEAGSAIAADLHAAGATVRGFDPLVSPPAGVLACRDDGDAATGATITFALTSGHEAEETLRLALAGLRPGDHYADLNTAAPAVKQRLAVIAAEAGIVFTDVALMSPVPGKGLHTPMLVSGTGATHYAEVLRMLGATVDVVEGEAGTAAARKLVRSVFYKGWAAAVTESLRAGEAAGCGEWLRENIRDEIASATGQTLDRLEQGSITHARRRTDEMAAATDLLTDLGIPPRVAAASRDWLAQLDAENAARKAAALEETSPETTAETAAPQ